MHLFSNNISRNKKCSVLADSSLDMIYIFVVILSICDKTR